jgi:hypothetical protein
MSTPINDGGPAFPFDLIDVLPGTGEQGVREQHSGLSIRDYFAAKAMQGLLAGFFNDSTKYNASDLPKEAFMIADAMIAARNGGAA